MIRLLPLLLFCIVSMVQAANVDYRALAPAYFATNGMFVAFKTNLTLPGTTLASNLWDASNVKFWGALGNGSSDDTVAISNAIRWATGSIGRTVYFPAGMYSNTVPINLVTNGINIIGDSPTIAYVTNTVADTSTLSPLGGTWINCAGTNFLTGYGLRGLSVENIGLTNFYTAFTFGSNNVEGASFSQFRNIIGIGRATVNQSEMGIENYNFLFCRIDAVRFYNVNTALRLVNQNNFFQGGNSLVSDFYTFTYPKSVANGNNTKAGIQILGLTPTTGTAVANNMITLLRPQVNSFNGDGTGTGILIQGASVDAKVANVEIGDSDVEGTLLYSIFIDQCYNSHFRIIQNSATPGMVHFTANGYNNFVDSCDPATIVTNLASGPNVFNGVYSPLSTTNAMKGSYLIAGPNILTTFNAVKGAISSDANGYTSPNVDGTGTASYHPGGVYAKGGASYLYSSSTFIDGSLGGSGSEWLILKSGSSYFNGGSVGIGNTAPAAKLDVTGNIRASTTMLATNGHIFVSNTYPISAWSALGNSGCITWMSNATLYLICTNSINSNATTNKLGGL